VPFAENFDVEYDPSLEGSRKGATATDVGNDGIPNFTDIFNGTDLDFANLGDIPPLQGPLMQPAAPARYHNVPQSAQSPTSSSPYSQTSPTNGLPSHGTKRKVDSLTSDPKSPPQNLSEASRLAAEEDKRRRNTAASARFRVKKKEREEALVRTVKEVTDKNTALERRVNDLEMENALLSKLLTKKNESKDDARINELREKTIARGKGDEGERIAKVQKEGVGTGVEATS